MKKYLVGATIAVFLGTWAYSSWWHRAESNEKAAAKETQEQIIKSNVFRMALNTNAVMDWPEQLTGGKQRRYSRILTAELQKIWIIDRPILFIGELEDAVKNNDGTYDITVDFEWLEHKYNFSNTVRVKFQCPESVAAPIIVGAKNQKAWSSSPNIAVIGTIKTVETVLINDSEGDPVNVSTGTGKCIAAMFFEHKINARSMNASEIASNGYALDLNRPWGDKD